MEANAHVGRHARRRAGQRPVAYFSAEFGLHESLPIYSGGLGVLAGDHLKSATDLGIPLVPSACSTTRAISSSTSTERLAAGRRTSIRRSKPADGAGARHRRQADHRSRSTPAAASSTPRSG